MTSSDARYHAAAILKAVEDGDSETMKAVAVASCHAEDAYYLSPRNDGDAARYNLAMAFLRSLAVGVPEGAA